MFRNNFNRMSFDTNHTMSINTLRNVRETLINQRENYITLLNETNRMIEMMDSYINGQDTRTGQIPSYNRVLTNDEILRYTTAHLYNEIEYPVNSRCNLSGIVFRDNDWVCKLPCGHLFDGPSICYHLTRINSTCPTCNFNLLDNSNLNTQQPTTNTSALPPPQYNDQPRPRTRTRTTLRATPIYNFSSRHSNSNLLSTLLTDEFLELFSTSFLGENSNATNLLTEEEIAEATEETKYGDIIEPLSERCPISYIEFTPDTTVTQIKQCKHIFDVNSLSEWLSRKTTCPVCRCDLKLNGRQNNNNDTNNNSNNNTTNNYTNNNMRYDISGNYVTNDGYSTYYYYTRRV